MLSCLMGILLASPLAEGAIRVVSKQGIGDSSPPWYANDFESLTSGTPSSFGYGGDGPPSVLLLFGNKTFPVVTNGNGEAVMAGAIHGSGKVVAFGGTKWMAAAASNPAMRTIAANALEWVADGKTNPKVATNRKRCSRRRKRVKVHHVEPSALASRPDIHVYYLDARYDITPTGADALVDFVKNGGGVLAEGRAWKDNSGSSYGDDPLNRFYTSLGMLAGYKDEHKAPFSPGKTPPASSNALQALRIVAGSEGGEDVDEKATKLLQNQLPLLCGLRSKDVPAPLAWFFDVADSAYDRLHDGSPLQKAFEKCVETNEEEEEAGEEKAPFHEENYKALADGISEIKFPASNSFLTLFGEKAFPLVLNSENKTEAAGTEYFSGRMVVFGGEGWLDDKGGRNEGVEALAANAVKWVSNNKANPTVATNIPQQQLQQKIGSKFLATYSSIQHVDLAASDPDTDVFILEVFPANVVTTAIAVKMAEYLKDGGGVVAFGRNNVRSQEPDDLAASPVNQFYMKTGIFLREQDLYNRRTTVDMSEVPSEKVNLLVGLEKLNSRGEKPLWLVAFVKAEMHRLPGPTQPNIKSFYDDVMLPIITDEKIQMGSAALAKTLVPQYIAKGLKIPVAGDAGKFPGGVPDSADRVSGVSVTIDGTNSHNPAGQFPFGSREKDPWRSTGLYAAPGDTVTLQFPANFRGSTLKVSVGCHTDTLYTKKNLKRSPNIVLVFDVDKATVKVGNPWGGLLYVRVPRGATYGEFQVTVSGAVRAPYFVLGQTTVEDWKQTIRSYPAPHAEFEIPDLLVLTLPSKNIRKLDDPSPVLELWKKATVASRYLIPWPSSMGEQRQERMVADVQISVGWFHSGYPIMGHDTAKEFAMDADVLRAKGSWVFFHEVGHNYQWESRLNGKNVETTNNWWGLYGQKTAFNLTYYKHTLEARKKKLGEFVAGGKELSGFALQFYGILADEFGWETFRTMIEKYYEMPLVQKSKRDSTWARVYTEVVKKDLCPYFKWWNWPLDQAAEDACAKYSAPDKDPLADYIDLQ